MRFGRRDQPIQALAPNGADDALADRIGLRAARRRLQHRDSESGHGFVEVIGEDAVAIVQQVMVSLLEADSLAQLLQRPSGRRMRRDVAMNQTTTAVLDNNEYLEQSERGGHDDQEVAGDDSLCVQAQEGRPPHVASWPARRARGQVLPYRSR